MANVWGALTEAEVELINSLGQEDIPTKLRCAICSKLAANAYKLPCCGQLIDGRCHSTLPSTCPVCEHNPLSAADCNPNKAMRSTIKVFLKTEMKKRENSRPKEPQQESLVATPSEQSIAPQPAADPTEAAPAETVQPEPVPDATPSSVSEAAPKVDDAAPDALNTEADTDNSAAPGEARKEQPSADPVTTSGPQVDNGDEADTVNPEEGQGAADQVLGAKADGDDQQTMDNMNDSMNNSMNGGFGFNAMDGSAPNMNFAGGDMNQMQMMMAMQNGMMPNGFNFPMMGMDPMMQNQMYMASGGFGNQGMGMNGMNMMGGGFGGNATGSNNWNGPQSQWGGGQDNYNHPNASGMGNGDYYNSGFPQAGFNHQGNFGGQQSNSYNMNRGFGRGRGRGRGFYGAQGRGGYNNFGQHHGYGPGYQNQHQDNQQYGMNGHAQDSQAQAYQQQDAPQENSGSSANVDEYGRQLRPEVGAENENAQSQDGAAADVAASAEVKPGTDETTADTTDRASCDPTTNELSNQSGLQDSGNGVAKPNLTLDSSLPLRTSDAVMSPALGSAKSGRDGSMGPPAVPQPSVPFNAPSGPKAMRQGLPNTSLLHLRARGLLPDGNKPQSPRTSEGLQSPSGTHSPHHADSSSRRGSEHHNHDRTRDRRDRRDDDRRSESVSSRGGSRDREDSHRRKRQRSASVSDDERDSGRHRRSRHHHSRKDSTHTDHESRSARSRDRKHGDRSRSASPDEKKSSHRSSRRDRDSDKRRARDKDSTHESRSARSRDRKHGDRSRSASPDEKRSSHRSSRRDRDSDKRRDRDKERERDRDRDRDRHRDRDRDRDRDKDRRSKKSTDEPPTPKEPSFNPPTGPKGPPTGPRGPRSIFDVNIKGASLKTSSTQPSRRSSQASASTPTAGSTPVDAYAAERERRQQERLIAETKKLAGLAGFAGVKRPSESGDADDAKRGRRKRTREAVMVDDVNERLRRGEAEREARRH